MSDARPGAQGRGTLGLLAIAAACAAGVAVRLWNVRDQVLGGDELHAVAIALGRPLGWILTTYSLADYSIPLTAGIRVWLEAGGHLSELGLRAPGLLSGAALVAFVGAAVARSLGAATGARAAWLVALAPGLVLYSRIVRSYAPMVLLTSGAACAAWIWIDTRSRRAAAAYVALAALATWFHLGAGPFVVAPLAFAVALRAAGAPDSTAPSARSIAVTAGGLALAFGLFLVPARASLLHLIAGVRSQALPDLGAWIAVGRLQAGASDAWLAAAVWAFGALGLASLWRARPRLAAYGAMLVATQIASLVVLRPSLFEYSFILNRYLLPCSVVLLVWVAIGLGAPFRRPVFAALATAVLLATAAVRGPLASAAFLRGSFAHGNDAVSYETGTQLGVDPSLVPPFYAALATSPAGALVEVPWHAWWQFSRLFAADQRQHGRRVLVAGDVPGLRDPRLAFRNFVAPEPAALARTDAAWVVVHLDLESEQARVRGLPSFDTFGEVPAETRAEAWAMLRQQASEVAAQLESAWGPADVTEANLRAWRLPRP